MSGWGIGFFREGQVHIEKSCEGIYEGGMVHDSFRRLARVIGSRTIISHIRCPQAGHQRNPRLSPSPTTSWSTTGSSVLPGRPRAA